MEQAEKNLLLLLFCRLTPILPEVKAGGGFDETFFPPFLRPASTAHSLWATISCDLCQTVILHSSHMDVPLSSSNLRADEAVIFKFISLSKHTHSHISTLKIGYSKSDAFANLLTYLLHGAESFLSN